MKKENEFNLSDKIQEIITEVNSVMPNPRREMIEVEDIKEKIQEFLSEVKEELHKEMKSIKYIGCYTYVKETLDKLALKKFGGKLI